MESKKDSVFELSMVMALAKTLGVSPEKYAQEFVNSKQDTGYLLAFTMEVSRIILDDMKKKNAEKGIPSPLSAL